MYKVTICTIRTKDCTIYKKVYKGFDQYSFLYCTTCCTINSKPFLMNCTTFIETFCTILVNVVVQCTNCTDCTNWYEVTILYELHNILYNIVTVWFADVPMMITQRHSLETRDSIQALAPPTLIQLRLTAPSPSSREKLSVSATVTATHVLLSDSEAQFYKPVL